MQNSGLGNCTNALASLNVASFVPLVLVMSQPATSASSARAGADRAAR